MSIRERFVPQKQSLRNVSAVEKGECFVGHLKCLIFLAAHRRIATYTLANGQDCSIKPLCGSQAG
jgi:hypothetical protein